MSIIINPIHLKMPFKLGTVNCYLIKNKDKFILIDTGSSNTRSDLEKALSNAGCRPGNLTLILLTHGDFDHTGNASFISKVFAAPIAIHATDAGMVEWGNMFAGRKNSNPLINLLSKTMFGFGKSKRVKPDLLVDEDFDFSEYGLEAQIIHIPGHSAGSIGILTPDGELICGDLFENVKTPALNSIMDDLKEAEASVEKLREYKIDTLYPGHGNVFQWEAFLNIWDR